MKYIAPVNVANTFWLNESMQFRVTSYSPARLVLEPPPRACCRSRIASLDGWVVNAADEEKPKEALPMK